MVSITMRKHCWHQRQVGSVAGGVARGKEICCHCGLERAWTDRRVADRTHGVYFQPIKTIRFYDGDEVEDETCVERAMA